MAEVHRDNGVDLRLGVGVEGLEGGERVQRVVLSDGTAVEADVVVIGVGVRPNTEWLEGSGLTLDDGVVCDSTCLAAPGVVAAGDVARWFNTTFGEVMRVEHWENAQAQGDHAARRLLADLAGANAEDYAPVPWFWSDQYDVKLQIAGFNLGYDETVMRPGTRQGSVSIWYYREGRLIAVDAINDAKAYVTGKKLLDNGLTADKALIADPATDLKQLLA